MATPRRNELWKIQSKHDKHILLTSPALLLQAAFEYFAWCDKHPLLKYEAVKSGADCGRILEIPLRRPYSFSGFCVYIGCSESTLEQAKLKNKEDIAETIVRIEDIIRTQLFEGAAVGNFSASIVAKYMGRDNTDSKDEDVESQSAWHIEVLDEKAKENLLLLREKLSQP